MQPTDSRQAADSRNQKPADHSNFGSDRRRCSRPETRNRLQHVLLRKSQDSGANAEAQVSVGTNEPYRDGRLDRPRLRQPPRLRPWSAPKMQCRAPRRRREHAQIQVQADCAPKKQCRAPRPRQPARPRPRPWSAPSMPRRRPLDPEVQVQVQVRSRPRPRTAPDRDPDHEPRSIPPLA